MEESHPLVASGLELVRALVQRHPDASAGMWTKMVLSISSNPFAKKGSTKKCPTCSQCTMRELTPLVELVHSSSLSHNDEVVVAATQCIADLIERLPLQKWLGSFAQGNTPTISGFGRSIVESLISIIEISQCRFLRKTVTNIESLAHLTRIVLCEIPYQDQHSIRSASNLCASLGNLVFDSKQPPKVQEAVVSVLISSAGGKVTPQGVLTPMSIPTRAWLDDPSSCDFLGQIMSSIESTDDHSKNATKMSLALLRTRPEIALFHWGRFEKIVCRFTESESHHMRLAGLQLLEALIVGRKDFGEKEEDPSTTAKIATLASSILENTRTDLNTQCRCVSFQAYGSLIARDWMVIYRVERAFLSHVYGILSHCQDPSMYKDGEAVAKVRSAACKAIGDACTQFLSSELFPVSDNVCVTEKDIRVVCNDICGAVLEGIEDPKWIVRNTVRKIVSLHDDNSCASC
jgi:hypothetical protein